MTREKLIKEKYIPSADNRLLYIYIAWGPGERKSTAKYKFREPANEFEHRHNVDTENAVKLLIAKKSQEINSSHSHPELAKVLKSENFLDFYDDYVLKNARAKNRHLSNSSSVFKTFLNSDFIKTEDITEDLCKKFRASLLKKYNGETPGNYFARFKQVIKAATKEGYFERNPVEGIQSVKNHNTRKKETLEFEDGNHY